MDEAEKMGQIEGQGASASGLWSFVESQSRNLLYAAYTNTISSLVSSQFHTDSLYKSGDHGKSSDMVIIEIYAGKPGEENDQSRHSPI